MKKNIILSYMGKQWRVSWERGGLINMFDSGSDAIAAAKKAVASQKEGHCGKIIVINEHDGSLKIIWQYGKDPFPPR